MVRDGILRMEKKSKLLYDGILLLGIVLVVFAGVKLYQRYADREASNRLYEDLNEQYILGPEQILSYAEELVSPSEEDSTGKDDVSEEEAADEVPEVKELPWYRMTRVNFEALKEINQDVVGWISFENEDISYPIVYSGDNSKYLQKGFDGKRASAGCIFLDGENTPDLGDSRLVIYGHNMKNLSMFGKLKYYREEGYYEDHQYFQILTEDTIYRYQVFSYFEVAENETEICRVDFTSEKDYSDLIKELLKRSMKDTGIEVDGNDTVATLLTCYTTGRRMLINAVMVDSYHVDEKEGEKPEQEIVQESIL